MKLYRHRVTLDIVSDKKSPKLTDLGLMQSPGPVSYIYDDYQSQDIDPFVEAMQIKSLGALSEKEVHDILPVDAEDPVGRPNKAGKQHKSMSATADEDVEQKLKLAALNDFHGIRHGQMDPPTEENYKDMWKNPPVSFEEMVRLHKFHKEEDKKTSQKFKQLYGEGPMEWAEEAGLLHRLDEEVLKLDGVYEKISDQALKKIVDELIDDVPPQQTL